MFSLRAWKRAAGVCCAAFSLAAAASPGDEAFNVGDYRNAEKLYRAESARTPEGSQARFETGCKLTRLFLAAGDFAAARKEWNALKPAADADRMARKVLDCALLMAEGKDKESAALAPEKDASFDAGLQLYSLQAGAMLRLREMAGLAKLADNADSAAKTPTEQVRAAMFRVYLLAITDKLAESGKLLASLESNADAVPFAAERRNLKLLLAVREKKLAESRELIANALRDNGGKHSGPLFDILLQAADNSETAGAVPNAAEYLTSAVEVAPSLVQKRAALNRLLNLRHLAGRKDLAADCAELLLASYPEKSAEHADWLLQCARLRTEAGQKPAALAHYAKILRAADGRIADRLAAARESATLFAEAGEQAKANAMLLFIIENGRTPDERQEGNFLLGEAAYRNGDYRASAEYFNKSATSEKWRDRSLFWAVQSYLRIEDYVSALDLAELLSAVKDPDFAASGFYYRAVLLEKSLRKNDALAAYRKFFADYPKSSYVRDAKFNAAKLAFDIGSYADATALFADFAGSFESDPAAPNACYRALCAAFLAGNRDAMPPFLEKLFRQWPDSVYTAAAVFHMVDILDGEHRENEALALLDRLEKAQPKPSVETASQLRYDRARLLNAKRRRYEALQVLDALVTLYPTSLRCADALFLAGNIHSDLGEYAEAAEAYRRAAALRPGGGFSELCEGRIADVNFSAAALKSDDALLDSALALYTKLAKSANPALAVQSFYKIGKCHELAGNTEKALAVYDELLYDALAARREKRTFPDAWAGKAAYSACSLYLADGTMASAQEALRVLRLFRMLDIDTGEDFGAMEKKIREKYRI